MKLSNQELNAIASYALNKIKEKNKYTLTKEDKEYIKGYVKKRDKLCKAIEEINKNKREMVEELRKYYNFSPNQYIHQDNTLDKIIECIAAHRNGSIPTLHTIREEIIMKSLFSSEKELKTFIDELVKKY